MSALDDLIAAVERSELVSVPSIRSKSRTMRIMGYVEKYAMVRHKGCAPFCVGIKEMTNHLRALQSMEAQGAKGDE